MYKIGLSSAFDLNEENFEKLNKSKISAVEICKSADEYKNINYSEIKTLSDKYNVKLWSYHLPFNPFDEIDISSKEGALRESTLSYFSELIKKASDIGIDKFVVHPSAEPIPTAKEERNERLSYCMQSLDTLAEIAAKNGAVIAVEDLPRSCLGNTTEEILMLISANDKLKVCFDTNHLLKGDNVDFIKKLNKKIITLHISDFDFVNERHWLPGEGKIDWVSILAALKEAHYNGVWMYEISLGLPRTIIRERELTFKDFYDNATSLFEGKKPPIFSTPKENLGMWE